MLYQSARLVKLKGQDKAWRGVLSYKDAEGAWRQRSRRLKATTEQAAKRELAAWRAEMESESGGEAAPVASVDVSDYVDSYIDAQAAVGSVTSTTVLDYRGIARRIRRTLGPMRLDRLSRSAAEEWEGRLSEDFAPATVIKCHRLLKMVLDRAVLDGMLARNPLDGVRPPRKVPAKPGINSLDSEGRAHLVSVLEPMLPSPTATAAMVSLFTGLRRGEVCGLRWSDVDLDAGVLWVRRSIGEGTDGTYVKEPKNAGSARDVAIPARLADVLRRRRASQGPSCEWVVGDAAGYLDPHAITREWGAIARLYDIRGCEGRVCTFHDLRHSWATAAVAAGVDIKTVSSNLGHASAAMTLDIYASADPDAKRRAAERMNEVI